MSERTTRRRTSAHEIADDMDEADRLAALAKDAMHASVTDGISGDRAAAAVTMQAATGNALASLATFYAVRATWTTIPTDKEI